MENTRAALPSVVQPAYDASKVTPNGTLGDGMADAVNSKFTALPIKELLVLVPVVASGIAIA